MIDPNHQARLLGVLAMLALPEVRTADGRMRRVHVEIEVAPDLWATVTECEVSSNALVFRLRNGIVREYRFRASEGCPAWRADHDRRRGMAALRPAEDDDA